MHLFGKKNEADDNLFLVAGLGNPGDKYAHTRHNVGFDCVDALADELGVRSWHSKMKGLYASGRAGDHKLMLIKPQTFMNNSGQCLRPYVDYYKVDATQRLIVIYDDISLEPGHIRVRPKGSAGGHNGMKSIISSLGTEQFIRIKVGVGKKPEGGDLVNHVLGHFVSEDRKLVEESMKQTIDALRLIMDGRIDEAMNRYNRKEKL